MRASLIIATKGRPAVLAETLDSLLGCDPPPGEVLIVDADDDRSAEPVAASLAERSDVPVRYLTSVAGLPRQRNAGIDAAAGDVVVFADDDVDFDPAVFGALLDAYADPGVVAATGHVVEPETRRVGGSATRLRTLLPGREGTMTRFGYPRRLLDRDTPRDLEFLHGCLMSARRDVAARERFDESLPGYALAEDEDFGYRMSRRGRVRYVPGASVVHKKMGFRTLDTYAFNRQLVVNRAHLFRKNFPDRSRRAQAQFGLMFGLLAAHRAVNGDWRGVRGLSRGARDALRTRR